MLCKSLLPIDTFLANQMGEFCISPLLSSAVSNASLKKLYLQLFRMVREEYLFDWNGKPNMRTPDLYTTTHQSRHRVDNRPHLTLHERQKPAPVHSLAPIAASMIVRQRNTALLQTRQELCRASPQATFAGTPGIEAITRSARRLSPAQAP